MGLSDTLSLALAGILGASVLGLFIGCIASLPALAVREVVSWYIAPMQNLPIVVKLFFFYFVLGFEAFPAAITTLVLHHSAYIARIVSSGFRSLPREQLEASLACGHSYAQTFLYVLLPQALRITFPPLTSQAIDLVKNSSVCMLIGIEELTFQTQEIGHITFRGFEVATAVSIMYLAIALVISTTMTMLNRRLFAR